MHPLGQVVLDPIDFMANLCPDATYRKRVAPVRLRVPIYAVYPGRGRSFVMHMELGISQPLIPHDATKNPPCL